MGIPIDFAKIIKARFFNIKIVGPSSIEKIASDKTTKQSITIFEINQ